jgi:hypothetical protein
VSHRIQLRVLLSLVAAATLVLAAAGGVLAKCEHPDADGVCPAGMVATFDPAGTLTAGSTETVGVWIHEGEVPYAADRVEVVFSRVGDGTVLRVAATPTSLVGRWQATVDLPAGGSWALAADVAGPGFAGSLTLDTIQVEPPVAPPAGPFTSPTGPIPVQPWVALAAIAALAAVIGGGIMARNRRRAAPAQG